MAGIMEARGEMESAYPKIPNKDTTLKKMSCKEMKQKGDDIGKTYQ